MEGIASVKELLEELKAGRPVILVDDEDRENEGDLIMAAEKITPAAMTTSTARTKSAETITARLGNLSASVAANGVTTAMRRYRTTVSTPTAAGPPSP